MAYGNCVPLRDVFIRGSQHITRPAAVVALWVEGLAVQGAEGGSEGEERKEEEEGKGWEEGWRQRCDKSSSCDFISTVDR